MGTTSQKLTYLNGTKQKLKQAINNIGGEVTDETTFREYVNQLENAYDRLPKTEFEEGESVTLENTLKGKLDYEDGIVGIGQTEQRILPSEYQQVEYIESTGTQYIDTGVIGKNIQTSFECKCTFSSVYGGSAVNSTGGLHYILDGDATLRTGGASSGYSYTLNQIITIKTYYDAQNRRVLDVDGTLACIGTAYNSSDANILIFRLADTSTQKGRLYWFKIYNDNELVFDGIPCYRISDNVIGLYDTVNNVFHTNSGTGTFTKGANIPNPSYPQEIKCVTGNQDVVVKDGNNNTIATYQLSLGEYEFNGIGDYKDELIYDVDEDKVYKNEVIEEHTGTELAGSFQLSSGYSDSTYLCAFNNNFMVANYVNTTSLCNYFSGEYVYSVQKVANNMRMGPSALVICVLKSDFADINALNQYFTDNGANIKFLLVSRTPTLTEITDTTLINQVKALYNAHSNNGTTIITSNGNLPMIIKCRALKGE